MITWLSKSAKNANKPFFETTKFIREVHLDVSKYPDLNKQLQLLKLTKEDLAIVKQLQPHAGELIPVMVEQFYASISLSSELMTIIQNTTRIEKLKVTLHKHLTEIFNSRIDTAYIEERKVIARVHVRIGLKSKWYLASFQSLMTTFIDFINTIEMPKEDATKAINAFSKLINFEQQLVIEAYENEEERIRNEAEELKHSLVHTIQNTAKELNAISEETNASLQEIAVQTDEIATSTVQGLNFVAETELKSSVGKDHLQTQTKLMTTVLDRVDVLETSMAALRVSSKKSQKLLA